MPEKPHVHIFTAKILPPPDHIHFYSGITDQAGGDDLLHTHLIQTITTAYDGHDHTVNLETGPGLATGTGHVHLISGFTSESGHPAHKNNLNDLTGPSLQVR